MTDKQKQIEELADFIYENNPCPMCDYDGAKVLAGRVYRAGYRKRETSEWLPRQGYAECVSCHAKSAYQHNFCPNCGAKMEGGESDA